MKNEIFNNKISGFVRCEFLNKRGKEKARNKTEKNKYYDNNDRKAQCQSERGRERDRDREE